MKIGKSVSPWKLVYLAGVCSFTFFLILALCWRNLLDVFIETQIRLNPFSALYNNWIKNQVPIYLEIYLFNFTNSEEFKQDKTVVPNFEEIGPFIYEETREKSGIFWNDSEQTVTFNQTKNWRFIPELSLSVSTKITNINPVASTIAYISRLWESELQRKIANALLNAHEPLFVTATAQEWIFDGIPDEFLKMFDILRKVTDIPIPYDKFGWFYERNGSSTFDGAFTIKTGATDVCDLGMLVAWNQKNQTDHYVDSCALVRGYTGEIFPPLKSSQESLQIFASDICSYISLKRDRTVLHGGVHSYEYIGGEEAFDNGTSYPENECFYSGESCPSGLRNVSSCRFGSPAFISFPHFYLADAYYTEKITGMTPDARKHKFTLKIEPKMGVPLAVEASFQINFLVRPYEWCDEFREVPKMYVPMLWFKQTAQIPKKYSDILRVVLFLRSNGGYMFFAYTFFIFFCILIFVRWRKIKPF